jgi:hypothetical protein
MRKILAILLSPLFGTSGLMILLIIGYLIKNPNFYNTDFDVSFTIQITLTIYIASLVIQCIIVEPLIYVCESFYTFTFIAYCCLAVFLCFLLALLFYLMFAWKEFRDIILMFLAYSFGNVLSYNYLYFRKLQK